MEHLGRITMDPTVMGGKPCIRGLRVTVGMIVEELASGRTEAQVLEDFPYLEEADIRAALAARRGWRVDAVRGGHESDSEMGGVPFGWGDGGGALVGGRERGAVVTVGWTGEARARLLPLR